ncbi:MAG: ribosome silencing factor [Methylacidiphilales bacterium]|nr:ribosome silencing factor [Candidatus Methylacidiphilales bacterium]MDW8349934.1 ribosome silencing factor [Verrucomicrobiae bacterium]
MYRISSITLAKFARKLALEKKALNPVILDMRKLTTVSDFFLILTAESEPQIKAILNHIEKEIKQKYIISPRIDGHPCSKWVIMDYDNVVVHIFDKEKRSYYSLETLWGDAPHIS